MPRNYSGAEGFRGEAKLGIEILRGYRGFALQLRAADHLLGPGADLKALSWPYYWKPGNNKATCYASENSRLVDAKSCVTQHPEKPYSHTPACPRYPECEYPSMVCACGFYAYFVRGRIWSSASLRIDGVIEGWGRSVIGELGFRSQWGRIVALARRVQWPHGTYQPRHPDLKGMTPGDFRNDLEAQRIEAAHLIAAVSLAFPDVPTYPDVPTMLEAHPLQGGPE